jgi:hypothetical protein
MKKSTIINEAFLHSLPIEVWHEDELVGCGHVVQHTLRTVRLENGTYYYKHMFDFRITEESSCELRSTHG